VRRTAGALRPNVHFHVLALNGVYVRERPKGPRLPLMSRLVGCAEATQADVHKSSLSTRTLTWRVLHASWQGSLRDGIRRVGADEKRPVRRLPGA